MTAKLNISMRVASCALAATLATWLGASAALADTLEPTPFETATLFVERNATDGDTEIVMEALAGDEGLRRLRIRSPDGRTIIDVSSDDPSVMGMREFAFESPEPPGEAILAAYPEGWYTFTGVSVSGERFRSRARLSHQLPHATTIVSPQEEEKIGIAEGLRIQWSAVPRAVQYIIELENESVDPEQALTFNVPPEQTSLELNRVLLKRESQYQISVAVVHPNGNIVVTETVFETK
jgi:hypothetical protein